MNFLKITLIIIILGITITGFAGNTGDNSIANSDQQSVELIINNERIIVPNINPNTKMDLFSILGSKVSSIDIRSGYGEVNITLPKGYYILKADNTTRKIAVK